MRQFSTSISGQMEDALVAIRNFRTVQIALSKISSKHIFHTFNAWRVEAEKTKRAEGLEEYGKLSSYAAQRVFNQHKMRAARKAFYKWVDVTEQALEFRRANKENAEKAARFDQMQRENDVLRTQRMAVALRKMMNMSLSAAWRQWMAMVAFGREMRLKIELRDIRARQDELLLRAADAAAANNERLEREIARLQGRLDELEEETRIRVLAGAVKRMTQATISKAYNTWKNQWFAAKREKLEKARERAEAAQEQWERDAKSRMSGAEAELEALRMQVLNKVVARMLNAKLAAAWTVWHGWWAQAAGLRKMMRRMLNGKLSQAFDRWWDAKCELVEMRVKISRCLRKIMNRQVSAAFDRWATMVDEAREMRVKLRRAAMKMANRCVSMAFAMWHENWYENKQLRIKLQRMIKRAKNAAVAGAFDRWCEAVEEIVTLRRKMKKIVNKMRNRVVSQVFYAWYEYTQDQIVMRENPHLATIANDADDSKDLPNDEMTRALIEMERKQKEKERAELEKRFRRAAMKMLNRRLTHAWETWMELHETVGELKRIMKRMLNGALANAFSRWVEAWEEIQHIRKVMLRISHRMKHRTGLAALERWIEMVEEAQHMRFVLNRALQKMMKRQMAGAFERWAEMAEEAKAMRVLVKRSLGKIMNRQMASAFERWAEMAEEAKHMRILVTRSLGKIMNRQLAQAFDRWVEMVEEAVDMRKKLRRCANMMMNKCMAMAWRLWCLAVQIGKDERTAYEELVGRAVRKMLNKQLAAAFQHWKDLYVQWRDYIMPKLKLAAGRMMNRSLAAAFACWRDNVRAIVKAREDEERKRMDRANRIIRRMMNRALSDAFSAWRDVVQEAMALKMKVRRAVMKMQRRQFAGAFARWVEMVDETKALRNLMERTVQRMQKRTLSMAWYKWKEDVRATLKERLRAKNAGDALVAKCHALLPQLESAQHILMEWVRAGGLRAMGGVVGSDVKLGTRKVLGEVSDMIGFLESLVNGDRSLKEYRDRASDVVEAATEVLHSVMEHVSSEAIYVRKALLMMREARARHATDLKVERARMLSVLRARLATLLRTEEARMKASFAKLMQTVKREHGKGVGGSVAEYGYEAREAGGAKESSAGGAKTSGNTTHFAFAEASLPLGLSHPGGHEGEAPLSAESQAAIESLVEAIASLENSSHEWEDYSERLIDAGEYHTSAGGVKIVDEDAGPELSKPGVQDFETLSAGVQGSVFEGMSPRRQYAEAERIRRSRQPKSWSPAPRAMPRLSHVSLKAEDAIERPAPFGRNPRPSTAAERSIEAEEYYAQKLHQHVPRTSASAGAGGGPRGPNTADVRLSQMEAGERTNRRSGTSYSGSRLSVQHLRADVVAAPSKLPMLPIPRRLRERLRYHEQNRPATTNAAASRAPGARHTSEAIGDAEAAAYDEQMRGAMRARSPDGFPVPTPRVLNPAAGGTGTRPTTSGEIIRGAALLPGEHVAHADSLAQLYVTRRRSPPRRIDGDGFEVEGRYAARVPSRSGRFIRPFKTVASRQWSVSGEPWTGGSDTLKTEILGELSDGEDDGGARPKTSHSRFPPRYTKKAGRFPTDHEAYIGDEGNVHDAWPHQQTVRGASLMVSDSKGDFSDTRHPAKSPYPVDKRFL